MFSIQWASNIRPARSVHVDALDIFAQSAARPPYVLAMRPASRNTPPDVPPAISRLAPENKDLNAICSVRFPACGRSRVIPIPARRALHPNSRPAIEDRRTSQGLSVLSYARSQDGTTAAAMHAVCDAA